MIDCPTLLYKYFSPKRVSVIADAKFRYCPLGAFNDPFEGRPSIKNVLTHEVLLNSTEAHLEANWRTEYERLPDNIRQAVSADQYHQSIQEHLRKEGNKIAATAGGLKSPITQQFHEQLDEHLGAACFSEVPDSLLMWAHYAADHTGFVVEFDSCHPHFHESRTPSDEFRRIRRVNYREARPTKTMIESDGARVYLVKSGHWAYEREWRIFRSLKDAHTVLPDSPHKVHLFEFPRESVKSIILGARIAGGIVDALKKSLSTSSEYGSVSIKRAVPDEHHFLLQIVEQAA